MTGKERRKNVEEDGQCRKERKGRNIKENRR